MWNLFDIGHEIGRKMLIRYFPGILCGFTRDADLKKCGFKREMTVRTITVLGRALLARGLVIRMTSNVDDAMTHLIYSQKEIRRADFLRERT